MGLIYLMSKGKGGFALIDFFHSSWGLNERSLTYPSMLNSADGQICLCCYTRTVIAVS